MRCFSPQEVEMIGAQHYLADEAVWQNFLTSTEHKISLLAFWADENYATMLLLEYDLYFLLSVKISLRRYLAPSIRYPSALWGEVMARDLYGVEAMNSLNDTLSFGNISFDQGSWKKIWALSSSPLEAEGKLLSRPLRNEEGRYFVPFSQIGGVGLCDIRAHLVKGRMREVSLSLSPAHRGIIVQLLGKTKAEALLLIEKISGAGFVAHPLAFLRACEAAEGVFCDAQERDRRLLFLELERIDLHLYDLGQMALHAKKDFLSSYCAFMREKLADIFEKYSFPRRLSGLFSEKRACNLEAFMQDILVFMKKHLPEVSALYQFFFDNFKGIGVLSTRSALLYGIGGAVGRASGRLSDMRKYDRGMRLDALRAVGEYHGCVFSRGQQRLAEIKDSLSLIEMIMAYFAYPDEGEVLLGQGEGLGFAEGARGDIWYWVHLKEGRIEKIFIRDPSLPLLNGLKEVLEGIKPEKLAFILSSFGFSPAGGAL